jgi:aldehyde:ferredoxin oxidoreductase
MPKVLYIDLTSKNTVVENRKELFDKYIGGTGVAIKLLLENAPAKVEPFAPEAPIIFAIGPLSAIMPCCTKVVAMFKSPLTGELGESHAGGRLAMAMRFAGYDAIVITGRAEKPVYLSIHDDDITIKDASSIWGISSVTSIGKILREREAGKGRRSIIRIGKAGENLVRFANVNVDTYRHFGRLGLGAVFGSKNLKAMVISGTEQVDVPDMKVYTKMYQQLFDTITKTEVMDKYHDLGTPVNINVLNQLKGLPTKNFSASHFESAENISGETLAENYLIRKVTCSNCPIGCIHIAELKTAFARGHEFEIAHISYDYELIYALGSNLGVGNPEDVLILIDRCEMHGLDAMSTGVLLAWATEMYERDLITPRDTLGIALRWGDTRSYLKFIDKIVESPSEFYKTLALGTEAAAKKYGGLDFAMTLGGSEVAGYHTGPASIVGQIFGVRHSHLDNAGYSVDQKASAGGLTPEQMVDKLIYEDNWRGVATSLVICLFARGVYGEQTIVDALASVGIHKTREELKQLGEEIYNLKYAFKKREGFEPRRVRIPKRFYETVSQLGVISEDTVKEMMELYIKKRKI